MVNTTRSKGASLEPSLPRIVVQDIHAQRDAQPSKSQLAHLVQIRISSQGSAALGSRNGILFRGWTVDHQKAGHVQGFKLAVAVECAKLEAATRPAEDCGIQKVETSGH